MHRTDLQVTTLTCVRVPSVTWQIVGDRSLAYNPAGISTHFPVNVRRFPRLGSLGQWARKLGQTSYSAGRPKFFFRS